MPCFLSRRVGHDPGCVRAAGTPMFRIAGLVPILLLGGRSLLGQQYVISTFAGGGPPPSPVPGRSTGIGLPSSVIADASGNIYFTGLHCVFKLDRNGTQTLIAGTARSGFSGDG